MRLKIGSRIRPKRECVASVSYQSKFDGTNRLASVVERWDITGSLVADPATEIGMDIALREFSDTFSQQGVSLVFLHEEQDIETPLKMDASRAIRGPVRVGVSLPIQKGSIYGIAIPYSVSYEAEFPASVGNNILSFTETIDEDPGGLEYVYVGGIVGPAQRQVAYQAKTFKYVQQGSAVGLLARPTPPPPIWPFALMRSIPHNSKENPKMIGNVATEFAITWRYEYEWHERLYGSPHTLYPY